MILDGPFASYPFASLRWQMVKYVNGGPLNDGATVLIISVEHHVRQNT